MWPTLVRLWIWLTFQSVAQTCAPQGWEGGGRKKIIIFQTTLVQSHIQPTCAHLNCFLMTSTHSGSWVSKAGWRNTESVSDLSAELTLNMFPLLQCPWMTAQHSVKTDRSEKRIANIHPGLLASGLSLMHMKYRNAEWKNYEKELRHKFLITA